MNYKKLNNDIKKCNDGADIVENLADILPKNSQVRYIYKDVASAIMRFLSIPVSILKNIKY